MSRSRWHITREAGSLTLSRCLPARLDVAAETWLPLGDPLRLAHQIRQDMWRALQQVRGFAPVVQVVEVPEGLVVTAGGSLPGVVPRGLAARIALVLEHPDHRARWLRHARRGRARDDASPNVTTAFDREGESAA